MRVLHTIQGLSKASGGPTTCTYQLLCGLRDLGIDAHITTMDRPDNIAIADFIHYMPFDCKTPLAISSNLGKYLKENIGNFDIVHANALWQWSSHQASREARKFGKPYVISPHGMLYPGALKVSAWKKKLILPLFQRKDLEKAVVIHATCEDEMRHIRNFGLKNPIAVVPNCIEVPSEDVIRKSVNDRRQIGFVGRINPYKNIHILLEAWHKLGDKTQDAELVIIGSGDAEYEQSLRRFVAEKGLNNVRFSGFLSGEALSQAVAQLDFQVLPSISENFGMVVPEALLRGVPVIASKGTPWHNLENFGCGWWVDNDADTLAATISEALTLSEADRRAMGQRGRQMSIDLYSIDTVAQQMKAVYEWILNGGEKPKFVQL